MIGVLVDELNEVLKRCISYIEELTLVTKSLQRCKSCSIRASEKKKRKCLRQELTTLRFNLTDWKSPNERRGW